jgi:segregation and condensation protein B
MSENSHEMADETVEQFEQESQKDQVGIGAPSLRAAIEALLLLTDEPMPAIELAQITKEPLPQIQQTLEALSAEYTHEVRGFDLREVAGGWRFYTRSECSPLIERWVVDGQQAKLTQAALETLSVIAYRQPVTRGRVSAVRGVSVDGVIKTLLTRGLIQEAGTENESGAIFYKTTSFFLERLGISSLEDLPPLAEHIPDLADLDAVLESVASGD